MSKVFLKAEWRKLMMANYSVDQDLLQRFVPKKTELDLWNDTCYVSLVGFMFLNTRIKGIRVPFHSDFEEANLRFYVRYKGEGEWKRGVVFIREIVPKPALTFVANMLYHENYKTMPMDHEWRVSDDLIKIGYSWKSSEWNQMSVLATNSPVRIQPGSEAEFITEHYWGYTKIGEKTSEYQVEHPQWETYPVSSFELNVDFGEVYGREFSFLSTEEPKSVFLAEGSEIVVKEGRFL